MTDGAAALRRAAGRYRGLGRFARHYVAGKLRWDPVFPALLDLAGPEGFGEVLDLGCGRGQLGVALLEAGMARSVQGFDCQPAQLAQARRAAAGLAFRAEARDLARAPALPAADTVLLIDVLYQMEARAQMALLAAAAGAARRRVLLRSADPARGWRSALSRGLERAGRRVWPHSGAAVNPLPLAMLAGGLERAGFRVSETPCWRGTPFANVLLVARRGPPPCFPEGPRTGHRGAIQA